MICIMCNVLMRDNYDLNNGLLYFYFEIMIFMFLVGLFFFCKLFFYSFIFEINKISIFNL